MKKFLVICLFILVIVQLFAISDYKSYIQNVPGLETYPNASAINVFTDIQLTINPDTSYTYEVFYIKKYLLIKGRKDTLM